MGREGGRRRANRGLAVAAGAALMAVAVAAAACSAPALPGSPRGAVKAQGGNCADLFATAMVTAKAVSGSWECLSSPVQEQFRSAGLEGDGGIAELAAQDPVYSREKYLGRLEDGAYVYSLAGGGSASVLVVWLDREGRVSDVRNDARDRSA